MKAKLSTHVLDLTRGGPAVGMQIELWRLGVKRVLLTTVTTNTDGRTDVPLLEDDAVEAGTYELVFFVRPYFQSREVASPFLDQVPIRFHLETGGSYHVPLLVTPWGYSTYRGS